MKLALPSKRLQRGSMILDAFRFGSGGANAHSYWRVNISAAQSSTYASLAILEFRATVGGADQCSGGTPIADSSYPGLPKANAFDGNTATVWASVSGMPHYIGYHFPSPVSVGQVAITSTDAAYAGAAEDLRSFTIESSDDGLAWNVEKTPSMQAGWSRSETRTFTVP